MPLVSVIVPAWNAAAFIHHPIASTLQQTLADLELLVVDDASSDGTPEAATAAGAGDARLRLLRLPRNAGPAGARNAALQAAQGRYLAVLDADDRMAPNRLERLIALAEAEQADIVLDNLLRCPSADRETGGEPHLALETAGPARALGLAEFVLANQVGFSDRTMGYLKPLLRTAFVRQSGLAYEGGLRVGEDYHFLAEAMAQGARVRLLPEPLYFYWLREGSLSMRPTAEHLQALLEADTRFQQRHGGRLSAEERAALRRRRVGLQRLAAYTRTRELALAGRYLTAATSLLQHPTAVANLGPWLSLRARRLLRAP